MSGGGSRMAISSSVRKMIQNIKEITGNHSDDEIHAMLKECSMDPNETAQKLLLQDTFHEVKRKRDRRKDNLNNKEAIETRKSGTQGRGSRGGRVNYSPRYVSHDAGSGRNSVSARENGTNQVSDKVVTPLPTLQGTGNKETSSVESSVTMMANGPTSVASGDTGFVRAYLSAGSGVKQPEVSSSSVDVNGLESAPPTNEANKKLTIAFGTGDPLLHPTPTSTNCLVATTPASSSAGCFSTLDPVLVPSNDSRVSGTVGTIKREVGSQRAPGESNAVLTVENKLTAGSEIGSSFTQGKMPSKAQGVGKSQLTESSQPSSTSTHGGSSVSRPLSNYNSRSQQIIGPQKVGSNKEWKPKLTNPDVTQGSGTSGSSEVPTISVEATAESRSALSALDSKEATSKLQRKLEELHLPQRQHVILPNHIHVPESERTKLSFGSFGASFGITAGYISASESDKSSTPSETSQSIEEAVEEHVPSSQNALANTDEGDYPDYPQSPTHVPENLSSGEGNVSSSALTEYNEPKQDPALLSGGHQYSMVHTSPNYSFGFVPPMLGSQVTPFENSESQARDTSHLPSFVVQQPFDPASYYAQFYRSGADSDGRLSPFPPPGVATKYNGNVSVLPSQTSQNPQEGGNSMVLSTAGPTPLATQAAGLMQSSITVTQQPVAVFRPPSGVHISHYPPNYIPYGHYFSPFYVPPPPIHQFLSNGAFPQQPQAGSVYPAPPAAAAAGVKYSLPQYKPGTNTGNSTHIAMPSIYGPYGSSPASYNPSSAATAGNSTSSEDLGVSQFKESNVYITGQQSEGSAVWIPATGRDISSLPPSSFYNLPQSQHVTFTPTQAAHGTFAGIYHPAQAVPTATVHPLLQQSQTMAGAVDMVGPATSVYQQPQHAQINWPSNY